MDKVLVAIGIGGRDMECIVCGNNVMNKEHIFIRIGKHMCVICMDCFKKKSVDE